MEAFYEIPYAPAQHLKDLLPYYSVLLPHYIPFLFPAELSGHT